MNTRGEKERTLVVVKETRGTGASDSDEFSFRIEFDDSSINGTYGGAVFNDGVATFKLRNGEQMVMEDLPDYAEYTIEETDTRGYEPDERVQTGTVYHSFPTSVVFINTKGSPVSSTGSLEVSKVTTGVTPNKVTEGPFKELKRENRVSCSFSSSMKGRTNRYAKN